MTLWLIIFKIQKMKIQVEKTVQIASNLVVILTLFIVFVCIYSCREEGDEIPSLQTSIITEISKTSAIGGGTILSDGGLAIMEKGICWSINSKPTIEDDKSAGAGSNSFTANLTGLTMGTMYYVRAYATNAFGTGYGDEVTFYTTGMVKDIDGNSYDTLRIESQTWMVQNLKTTKFNNGLPISIVKDNNAWSSLSTAAYCELNNDVTKVALYGRLYNFYTAVDNQKACPAGWRVATDADWTLLATAVGGADVAGGKLKSIDGWMFPNFGPENRTGFNALPGGYRKADGSYARVFYVNGEMLGDFGYWWTSTSYADLQGVGRNMFSDLHRLGVLQHDKKQGLSIRCIKDQ